MYLFESLYGIHSVRLWVGILYEKINRKCRVKALFTRNVGLKMYTCSWSNNYVLTGVKLILIEKSLEESRPFYSKRGRICICDEIKVYAHNFRASYKIETRVIRQLTIRIFVIKRNTHTECFFISDIFRSPQKGEVI